MQSFKQTIQNTTVYYNKYLPEVTPNARVSFNMQAEAKVPKSFFILIICQLYYLSQVIIRGMCASQKMLFPPLFQ